MLLMAAMAATSEICERKLVMSSPSVPPLTLPWRAKSFFARRMVFLCSRYQTESAAVSTWPMTVATAAPIMPQRKTKRKIGSRIVLAMAPTSVETMAKRGLPSARRMGFMAWPNM